MLATLVAKSGPRAVPIIAVPRADWRRRLAAEPASVRRWAETTHFTGEPGSFFLAPGSAGGLARVFLVLPAAGDGKDGGYGGTPTFTTALGIQVVSILATAPEFIYR